MSTTVKTGTIHLGVYRPCKSRVSLESRYGMCELFPSTSAEMTLPRADRLRLILVASFRRSPWQQTQACHEWQQQ